MSYMVKDNILNQRRKEKLDLVIQSLSWVSHPQNLTILANITQKFIDIKFWKVTQCFFEWNQLDFHKNNLFVQEIDKKSEMSWVSRYNLHILDFCILNDLGDIKSNKIVSIRVTSDALLIPISTFYLWPIKISVNYEIK